MAYADSAAVVQMYCIVPCTDRQTDGRTVDTCVYGEYETDGRRIATLHCVIYAHVGNHRSVRSKCMRPCMSVSVSVCLTLCLSVCVCV